MAESVIAAKYLQDAGYDCLNCDNGTYDSWYWAHPPVYMPLNCNLAEAEHISQFVDIPVIVAGRMQADTANASIQAGKIDAVAIGRQLLCDGEYLTKLKEGRYTAGTDPVTGKAIVKNVLGKTQAEVKEKLKKAIAESGELDIKRSGMYTVGEWMDLWYEIYDCRWQSYHNLRQSPSLFLR